MKSVAALLLVFGNISIPQAWAQESLATNGTYSFGGGACKSQGSWTRDALAATQSLLVVAQQMKDDPRCGGLSKTLQSHLTALNASVNTLNADAAAANRLSSLKEETLGLRKFVNGSGQMQNKVIDLILNNTIDAAVTATDITGAGAVATSILNTGQRINRATNAGLDILEKVMDSALHEEQCLSTPNTAGPFLSSMIEMTSAFAGSGQDSFGRRLSGLINQISQLMRQGKYVNVIKQLNQTQLRNSISCLMEVASNSYCSTLDAESLFKEQMGRLALKSSVNNELVRDDRTRVNSKNGSLEGYYILSQQVPVITQWLEKVQRGVEPRTKADGAFKNSVLQTRSNFDYTENELLANFNSAKEFVKDINSLTGKKNQVLKTLLEVSERLTNNVNTGVDNLFTVSIQSREIPFVLLGMEVPKEVLGENGLFAPPSEWLGTRLSGLSQFNNPEETMNVIDKNLRDLIADAKKNADSYYSKWFIYDQASLVVDSVTGITYNVRDSLKSLRTYLASLEQKVKDQDSDGTVLPMISETAADIDTVLAKYEELRTLGEEFKKVKPSDTAKKKELVERGKKINKELIETAYAKFNVQKGKSMYLANRVAVLVKKDFETMVESDKNFTTESVRNILYATGEAAFDRMKQMSAGNPKDVMLDINNALYTQKQNLQAIEMLFRDHFVATIAYTKMVSENRTPNDDDVRKDSWKRARKDYWEELPLGTRHVGALLVYPLKWADLFFNYYKGNSDKYPRKVLTSFGNNHSGGAYLDTETRSAKQMYEFYCIQSLAFNDWRPFKELCKSVVLKSPFVANNLTPQAQKFFDQTLNVSYSAKLSEGLSSDTAARMKEATNILKYAKSFDKMTEKQQMEHNRLGEQLSRNQSARICAYHTYSINNEVMNLTLGKEQK